MTDQNPSNMSPTSTDQRPALRSISSTELFGEERQLVIEHGFSQYFLTITRQGKLILTK